MKDFGETHAATVETKNDYGPQVEPEQLAGKRFTITAVKVLQTRYGERFKLVVYGEDDVFLDGFSKEGIPHYVSAEMWTTTPMRAQVADLIASNDLPCQATIVIAGSSWKLAGTDQIPGTDMTANEVPF